MDINSHRKLLKTNLLFKKMNDSDLDAALSMLGGRIVSYKKGETIHMAYEPMNSFGFCLNGSAIACMDDYDGNRIIMAEVIPGITFGESLCFLGIKDSPVYVLASSDCIILWLEIDKIYNDDSLLAKKLQKSFTSLLASRTLSMNNRIQILSKLTIRDKLLVYFSEQAIANGANTFSIPFDREGLASYIGTNRAALSRELAGMKKEGIIDYYKNTFKLIKK